MGCGTSNSLNVDAPKRKNNPTIEQKVEQNKQIFTNTPKKELHKEKEQKKNEIKPEKNITKNKINEIQKKKDEEKEKPNNEINSKNLPNNTITPQKSNIQKDNDNQEKVPNNYKNNEEDLTTKDKNQSINNEDDSNNNYNYDIKPIQKSDKPSAAMGKFSELLSTEYSGRFLETKSKLHLKFIKKKPKIEMNFRVYNGEGTENKDIKCLIQKRKDFIDIYYIFNYKGKYKTYLYAMDVEAGESYECVAYYEFQCEEEWTNGNFDFPIEVRELYDYDFKEIYENFKVKESSHKNIIFNAKNKEKINFKFKPDSDIIIAYVILTDVVEEHPGDKIERVVKYYLKDKNLDIDIIFNKKGKYKINIRYFDNSLFDGTEESMKKCLKYIFYYAVVETDAKEYKEFSDEEMLITQPFEDSLKIGNFKYISHKNQKVSAKDIETFEFEFESNDAYGLNSHIYPEENDSIYKDFLKIDNKKIYYFSIDNDITYLIEFEIVIWGNNIGKIVYIVSASDYLKNTPRIRKNILKTIDREKLQKLVLSSKKRTDIKYEDFLPYFRNLTKNLTNSEKGYALYYWMAENIAYDTEGFLSDNFDSSPKMVYENGFGVCSGYSNLFQNIGLYIGIFVLNETG